MQALLSYHCDKEKCEWKGIAGISGRNKYQKLVGCFFEDRTFCWLFIAIPLKMYSKMDFGWSNVKMGWKIANGQLLFLALGIQIG